MVSTRKSLIFPKISRKEKKYDVKPSVTDRQGQKNKLDKLKFDAQFHLGTYSYIKNELYLE